MGLLQDHVVIITGSASGIGYAAASAALNEGARVFGVDISPSPVALNDHPNFRGFQGDLTQISTAQAVVTSCVEVFGKRVDGLLNVAGVLDNMASVDSVTDSVWEKCLAVNLTAPMRLMRGVIPLMREQKHGSIVNVSSKAGISGAAAGVAYTASKHGLIGVTKNVAWRFKDENIRCNAICPGGVATNFGRDIDKASFDMEASETMRPVLLAHMPDQAKGLPISPEEVAQVLIFLLSTHSNKVNGAVIPVDDAWSTI